MPIRRVVAEIVPGRTELGPSGPRAELFPRPRRAANFAGVEQELVLEPGAGERFSTAFVSVDQREAVAHVSTCFAQRCQGLERGPAGRYGVVKHCGLEFGPERAFNTLLHTVRLAFLAYEAPPQLDVVPIGGADDRADDRNRGNRHPANLSNSRRPYEFQHQFAD